MSAAIISLLRNIEAIEHIRAAVCAAQEYERDRSSAQSVKNPSNEIAAIAL